MYKDTILRVTSSLMIIGLMSAALTANAGNNSAVDHARSAMETFNQTVSDPSSPDGGVTGRSGISGQVGHSTGRPNYVGEVRTTGNSDATKSVTWVDDGMFFNPGYVNNFGRYMDYWRSYRGEREVWRELSRRCGPESVAHDQYTTKILEQYGAPSKNPRVVKARHTAVCVSEN